MANPLGYMFNRTSANPIETDRQVTTITLRNAIESGRRWEGMLVYVISEGKTYQLSGGILNTNWTEISGTDATATHYRGEFDATAIDPAIDNSNGVQGDEYKVINGGVDVDFGSGDIRLNTGDIIIFHDNEWKVKVSNAGSSTKQPYFTATEGQTTFDIDPTSDNNDVHVNSVYQIEGVHYNRSGAVGTFTYGLTAGDIVSIRDYSEDSTTEQFTATEGQTVFTLSSSSRSNEIHANSTYQIQGLHYTISENILTFTYGLTAGDIVTNRKFR